MRYSLFLRQQNSEWADFIRCYYLLYAIALYIYCVVAIVTSEG